MENNQCHSIQITPNIQTIDTDNTTILQNITLPDKPGRDEIEIFVKNPGQPEQIYKKPFQSWTENFARYLCQGFSGSTVSYWAIQKSIVGGIVAYAPFSGQVMFSPFYQGGPGITGAGICVGASGGATSTGQYRLQSVIQPGTTNGQLSYGLQVIDTPVYVGGNQHKLTFRRIFTNQTTSGAVIREVGLFAQNYINSTATNWKGPWLHARDHLDASGNEMNISVASGGAVEIRYNFYSDGSNGLQLNWLKNFYAGAIGSASIAIPQVQNCWGQSGMTFAINYGGLFGTPGDRQYFSDIYSGVGKEYGIVCGASATPTVSGNDYVLREEYREGTSFGQLHYEATAIPNASLMTFGAVTSATGCSFYIQRQAYNNSPFTQTIREIGIYACGDITKARAIYAQGATHMIYRKVIPDIVLAPGQSCLIGINWQFPI